MICVVVRVPSQSVQIIDAVSFRCSALVFAG